MKRYNFLVLAILIFCLNFASSCDTGGKKDKKNNCVDSDGDLVCDLSDGCPADALKTAPGQCGCGNPETPDSDGDGTVDCVDGCPTDIAKIAPGQCGCSHPDTDGDGDGTSDCIDGCPTDIAKIAPGQCGCGHPDTDSDGDGTANCVDGCPADPGKITPGVCGCGVADNDSDHDGTYDCSDSCPFDPGKIAPGICGCGIADTDTDHDGTADCIDQCDNDPLKIVPGQCGCGEVDDLDGDGLADCDFELFTPTTTVLPSGLQVKLLLTANSARPGYALAVDSNNAVHIVYNGNVVIKLNYINNINGVWKIRNTWSVATLTNRDNSIAIDYNDRVHIATVGYATTPGEDLFYVSNETGTWTVEVADDDLSVGLYPIIKTDSNNKTHIFHLKWHNRPLYSTDKNGLWETSTIETLPAAIGSGWSFVLDNLDRPHAFYGCYGLWHAYLNAGTWQIENIRFTEEGSSATSYGSTIYLVLWSELFKGSWSSWTTENIYASLTPTYHQFRMNYNAIGADSNGKLHYAFTALDVSNNVYLLYMTNLKGSWQTYIIDQANDLLLPQLAIDQDNHVHLLYSRSTDYALRYVTFDPATF